jgi:hypothetical protein
MNVCVCVELEDVRQRSAGERRDWKERCLYQAAAGVPAVQDQDHQAVRAELHDVGGPGLHPPRGAFHPELCNACPIEWLCHHCYNNPTRKPKPCDHSDPHAFITCRRCPNRRTAQDQAALKPFYPNGYNWTCDRCRLDPVDSDDETDIDSDQSQQE